MSKFLEKLPKIVMWALFSVSVVIGVLFFVGGGEEVDINGNMWNQPHFTDALLNWSYILFGIACLVGIYSLIRFDKSIFFKKKKDSLTIFDVIFFSLIVFVVAWFCGSDAYINIIGYEGNQNVGFWSQFTDACIIASSILFAVAFWSAVATLFFKRFRKVNKQKAS